jgi:lipid II:glycine glycyltransferase (peptidoglycan interpeptide bridge formation enzyme)
MELQTKSFRDFSKEEWNNCVEKIPATSYGHTWEFLYYLSCFQNVISNESFICFDEGNFPVAICPYFISKNIENGNFELSSNGSPVFVPALGSASPSKRRKLLDAIFRLYCKLADEHKIVVGSFLSHPLNRLVNERDELSDKYYFEMQRYNMIPQLINTLVVDLAEDEVKLTENLSKYQRKNIRRAKNQNITVKIIDHRTSSLTEIESAMKIAQSIHFQSAGKSTRPQATWDLMRDLIKPGKAALFLGMIDDKIISYLFCGSYHKMAFGWSQANDEEFVKEYNVRHLIEWQAILYYKSEGYKYYELGERYYTPQIFHTPSKKELTIGQFKQNYGGHLMSKIIWRYYFNDDYMKIDLTNKINSFRDDYFKAQSELMVNFLNEE